jgi:hypothetical protein
VLSMKRTSLVALSAALALTLSACSDDSSEDTATTGNEPTSEPTPLAALDSLTGVQTAVTLDASFLEGLTTLQLTPAVLGGATLEGAKIAFPITGGEVEYYDPNGTVQPYVVGSIEHEGSGLSLTGGGKTVELENFVVDPDESVLTGDVTVDGTVAAEDAPLFFLDGRTLRALDVDEVEDQAVLTGTTVSLTAEAAELLNGVLGTEALEEFFPVGVAEIRLDLPAQTEPSGS